jgi:hypothetical protein
MVSNNNSTRYADKDSEKPIDISCDDSFVSQEDKEKMKTSYYQPFGQDLVAEGF